MAKLNLNRLIAHISAYMKDLTSEFQERFKSKEDIQLLRIIEESENYDPQAVEAARLELNQREIDPDDVSFVKEEIKHKNQRNQKRQSEINKLKSSGSSFIESLNPISHSSPSVDKKINWIVLIFGVLVIFRIYKQFEMIEYMLFDLFPSWNLDSMLYLVLECMLPIAILLLWFRKKIGWILMAITLIYNTINYFALFIFVLQMKKVEYPENDSSGGLGLILEDFENLFPVPSPSEYFTLTLFYGATFWVLYKKDIRNEFQIGDKTGRNLILIIAAFTCLFIIRML